MRNLLETLHGIRLAGLGNALRALRYARLRDRLDARHLPAQPPPVTRPRGRLRSALPAESGARFHYDGGELAVRFLAPDFLALLYTVPDGGLLYSDAGDGYGPHRLDRFGLVRAPGGWSLLWTSEGGHPWPYDEVSLEPRGFIAPRVRAGGTEVSGRAGRFALPGPGPVTITEEGSPA